MRRAAEQSPATDGHAPYDKFDGIHGMRGERNMNSESDEPPDFVESPEDREVRGWRWLVVPALAGLVIGAGVGAIYYKIAFAPLWNAAGVQPVFGMDRALLTGLGLGSAIGAAVGMVIGAFIWAFFPYKPK
jgi:hypothetical protein